MYVSSSISEWIVDSCASYHATPRKFVCTSYKDGHFRLVQMGNIGVSKIVEIGNVKDETSVGCSLVLINVLHVPNLSLNLYNVTWSVR